MQPARFLPLALLGILLLLALLPEESQASYNSTFDNLVDHFDPLNKDTYKQRYTVNDTFYDYDNGGPIFLFLSGEAAMEFFEFQEVYIHTWAQQFNALYVVIEHRYYGESFPTPDLSTNNMRFLSSEQALADAAYFLEHFNGTLANPGPWIVFGCSYSGALSAWFRAKYPNLVIGSIAPSGPVNALLNFTEYLSQWPVSASLFPGCVEAAQAGVAEIEGLLADPSGISQLKDLFQMCEPLTQDDIEYFKWTAGQLVGSSDQFQNPPLWPLNTTCDLLMNSANNASYNFAQAAIFNSFFDPAGGPVDNTTCISFSKAVALKNLHETSISKQDGSRSWNFQVCTEFGFFEPSYPGTSIFFPTIPLENVIEMCSQVFDIPNMIPDVNATNAYYGGYQLVGTNILFSNGLLDPWHNLSIFKNSTTGVDAVTYEAGHCAPLTAPTDEDPPSLVEARAVMTSYLQRWLDEAGRK
eukprot:TRINITY_DN5770_c0_g1_i1.p1 TRINITY_DN5770_c0_g1~~TRINITY_DN5770_c0_g1_i1.p1  ORF type:complete len:468 (+),score=83.33 TRINITY_DN5770_c0_g1_i1:968-2371(+)